MRANTVQDTHTDVYVQNNMHVQTVVTKCNNYLKRCFAQTMQWIGSEGVLRMVHPGKVFWAAFGWHS
jgi:hypothetical protein